MLSLQRNLSFGYLRKHRMRTLLVVLSIALGVATLVATRALNGCLDAATRQAANPLSEFTDLLVLNAQTGVPRSLARRLRQANIPGLQDAQPLVLGRVFLPEVGEGRSVLLLGIDWLTAAGSPPADSFGEAANPWGISVQPKLDPGAFWDRLRGKAWALVGPRLDRDLPESSRRFVVLAGGKKEELVRVGSVRFAGASVPEGGNFIVLDVAAAARLVFPARPENASQINVRLTPEARADPVAVEQVRRRVQQIVGDEGDVRTLEANFESARDVLGGLQVGFSFGGLLALVIGLFLVYNVLSVNVAERRHDIGVLRAVGATRTQVAGLFLGEAAFLGLIGSLLGLPLGWALGRVASGPFQQVLSDMIAPSEPLPLQVPWPVLAACVAAGTVTAVLAALFPAWQAASDEPADAVRRAPPGSRTLYLALHLLAVAGLLGVGAAMVVGRASLPRPFGIFAGAACLFVALLAAMPLVARVVGRLVEPIFRHLFGLEGWLAADNLARSPARTGLVIAALAGTGAVMVGFSGFMHSTRTTIRAWIDQSVAADLFVTCGGSLHTASLVQPMDETLGPKLKQSLPHVEAILGVRFHLLDFRDRIVFLLAVDADAFQGTSRHDLARNLARFPRLKEPGTVVVSENFASLYNVSVGDRITVRGRHGPLELEVIGTGADYTWNRGTMMVDRKWYQKAFDDNQVDLWDVYLEPGADAEAVRRVLEQRWGKEQALFAATRAELRQDIDDQLYRLYNLAYAQQMVIGMVALLGVASALFISVLQRRRQLGLLRAVGACRGQVLRSVLAEAALMGLIGGVLGLLEGLVLEWYVVGVMVPDEAGFRFPLEVPWAAAGVVCVLSAVLATLVGLWPAYLATRLRIPEAIAYE
jgi:putative ABC transport system permease protein